MVCNKATVKLRRNEANLGNRTCIGKQITVPIKQEMLALKTSTSSRFFLPHHTRATNAGRS